jgi:hypothetical protein
VKLDGLEILVFRDFSFLIEQTHHVVVRSSICSC